MSGEFEKQIEEKKKLYLAPQNNEWINTKDMSIIIDEARKEFPKFKVINTNDDQMKTDSYIDEFYEWFEKWFGK